MKNIWAKFYVPNKFNSQGWNAGVGEVTRQNLYFLGLLTTDPNKSADWN